MVCGLYSHAVHGSYSSVAGCGGLRFSACRALGCFFASMMVPNPNKFTGRRTDRGGWCLMTPLAPWIVSTVDKHGKI
jgi:hypothetical protein